jgi:DNA (cytosine-5)-methyltransferase 1
MEEQKIPVVDLFAGPGGLGEGFSSTGKFKIVVSAEMDPSAHKTLTLRAYYRLLKTDYPAGLDDYYNFCNGATSLPYSQTTESYWKEAEQEALQVTLGTHEGNRELDAAIKERLPKGRPWVLIGGPPCQAYSLVGRSRNKGNSLYSAETDHRHFLYKEYLRIIGRNSPDIFIMENVKGILSSKINGKSIFHDILCDLANPLQVSNKSSERYVICSLVDNVAYRSGESPEKIDPRSFIIHAEKFGIPQKRHRVILLGIREDVYDDLVHNAEIYPRLSEENKLSVNDVIDDLPSLRSRISRQSDDSEEWFNAVSGSARLIVSSLNRNSKKLPDLLSTVEFELSNLRHDFTTGALRLKKTNRSSKKVNKLESWYDDINLEYWLNHEARSHMPSDLTRYFFAACFAKTFGRPPKGIQDFFLPELKPAHKNWESGKFSDRFRVQMRDNPATTITSHISKDGHYFIHPDPIQCRSLTVREAARIQTFPDNYFFQGNRTQQYHQVGNAVPPLLARKIADSIVAILGVT